MFLYLDHHSGKPIYRQIVEEIKYRVASGKLCDNDRVPSIRQLAAELNINPRTVVRAYEELQHLGLVVMRQGQGVFISCKGEHLPASARRKQITEMTRRLLSEATRLGATPEEIMEILQSEARHIRKPS